MEESGEEGMEEERGWRRRGDGGERRRDGGEGIVGREGKGEGEGRDRERSREGEGRKEGSAELQALPT